MQKVYKVSKKERKNEENKRVAYQLQRICKKNDWKTIGVLSSTKYKKNQVVKTLEQTAAELHISDYTLKELIPLTMYAEALKEVQKCDAVLLAEKYNYSKYNEFEEMLCLLKKYDIPVVGVITF